MPNPETAYETLNPETINPLINTNTAINPEQSIYSPTIDTNTAATTTTNYERLSTNKLDRIKKPLATLATSLAIGGGIVATESTLASAEDSYPTNNTALVATNTNNVNNNYLSLIPKFNNLTNNLDTNSTNPTATAATIINGKKFKPCKNGKPEFQTKLLGPNPIVKVKRGNSYKTDVPAIDTTVAYKVQAKSCKTRKHVKFSLYSSVGKTYKKTYNMKPGQVRSFDYKVTFPKPNNDKPIEIRNIAGRSRFGIYQDSRSFLDNASIQYYYTPEQLEAAKQEASQG